MPLKFVQRPAEPPIASKGAPSRTITAPTWSCSAVPRQIAAYSPICQLCGKTAHELRPFGPNHESICQECADKDPETTELRWRELNPNG